MSNKPALAYDYRRYIELVQVLASDNAWNGVVALFEAWNVEKPVDPAPHLSDTHQWAAMIHALAKAAVEYHRSESE